MRTTHWRAAAAALLVSLTCTASAHAVVGGRQATVLDNPSMVGLVDHGQPATEALFCGGTLIAPTVVVTAMHCLPDADNPQNNVAGDIDVIGGALARSDGALQRVRVAELVTNPGWDSTRTLHDVLVLRLAAPLPLPSMALAGPADAALSAPGSVLRATGWGLTDFRDNDSQPDALKEADIPLVADGICSSFFGEAIFDGTYQLCGRSPGGTPDTCQGDSGGPLVGGPTEDARLVGIVSYGPPTCGKAGSAAVYADVASERDWILQSADLTGAAAAPPAAPAPPAAKRTVKTRLGDISCGFKSCKIEIRTSGKGRSAVKEVVLRVTRKQQQDLPPVKRYVRAKKAGKGRYLARTLLPYGTITVTAVAYDVSGAQLGKPAKETLEVE